MALATSRAPSRLLPSAIVIGSLISSFAAYVIPRWCPVAIDYAVFWGAVRRADPYRPDSYFVNPPPALLALQPLRLIGFIPGYVLWTILSLLLFFFAARRLVGDRAALLSLISAASIQGLLLGQAPLMLSAAILFAVSAPALPCGVILGCIAAIKPQLLLAAPFIFLVRRDWLAFGGMAAGAAASVLLSLAVFGFGTWSDWMAGISSFYGAVVRFQIIGSVITPGAFGPKLGLPLWPWLLFGTGLAALLIGRFARRADGANLAALMIVASILMSPYALPHDPVGAMPAVTAFMLSGPAIADLVLALAVFCGAFLPLTLPMASLWAAFRSGRTSAPARGSVGAGYYPVREQAG